MSPLKLNPQLFECDLDFEKSSKAESSEFDGVSRMRSRACEASRIRKFELWSSSRVSEFDSSLEFELIRVSGRPRREF